MNYNDWANRFAQLSGVIKKDINPTLVIPGAIEYGEQRIYRELDLLYTQTTDATKQVSSGVREFTVSTAVGTFITIDQFNIITPAATQSSQGVRSPLVPVSPDWIDNAYGGGSSAVATGVPEYYAMRSNSLVLLGPAPDGAYFAETIGIQRPAMLSSANSSTILTQYVPDLFMVATLIYASDFINEAQFRTTGQVSPRDQTLEQQYQLLIKSAGVEQFRAKHQAQGWTSEQPNPLVQRS